MNKTAKRLLIGIVTYISIAFFGLIAKADNIPAIAYRISVVYNCNPYQAINFLNSGCANPAANYPMQKVGSTCINNIQNNEQYAKWVIMDSIYSGLTGHSLPVPYGCYNPPMNYPCNGSQSTIQNTEQYAQWVVLDSIAVAVKRNSSGGKGNIKGNGHANALAYFYNSDSIADLNPSFLASGNSINGYNILVSSDGVPNSVGMFIGQSILNLNYFTGALNSTGFSLSDSVMLPDITSPIGGQGIIALPVIGGMFQYISQSDNILWENGQGFNLAFTVGTGLRLYNGNYLAANTGGVILPPHSLSANENLYLPTLHVNTTDTIAVESWVNNNTLQPSGSNGSIQVRDNLALYGDDGFIYNHVNVEIGTASLKRTLNFGVGSYLSASVQKDSTTTGGTVSSDGSIVLTLFGVASSLTINAPSSPANGEIWEVTTTQSATTITWGGGTFTAPPVSITNTTPARFIYQQVGAGVYNWNNY